MSEKKDQGSKGPDEGPIEKPPVTEENKGGPTKVTLVVVNIPSRELRDKNTNKEPDSLGESAFNTLKIMIRKYGFVAPILLVAVVVFWAVFGFLAQSSNNNISAGYDVYLNTDIVHNSGASFLTSKIDGDNSLLVVVSNSNNSDIRVSVSLMHKGEYFKLSPLPKQDIVYSVNGISVRGKTYEWLGIGEELMPGVSITGTFSSSVEELGNTFDLIVPVGLKNISTEGDLRTFYIEARVYRDSRGKIYYIKQKESGPPMREPGFETALFMVAFLMVLVTRKRK